MDQFRTGTSGEFRSLSVTIRIIFERSFANFLNPIRHILVFFFRFFSIQFLFCFVFVFVFFTLAPESAYTPNRRQPTHFRFDLHFRPHFPPFFAANLAQHLLSFFRSPSFQSLCIVSSSADLFLTRIRSFPLPSFSFPSSRRASNCSHFVVYGSSVLSSLDRRSNHLLVSVRSCQTQSLSFSLHIRLVIVALQLVRLLSRSHVSLLVTFNPKRSLNPNLIRHFKSPIFFFLSTSVRSFAIIAFRVHLAELD